ncbi:hypothetical protein ACSFC0_24080 [Serratia marcescens]|uniref:hypothetical protein n=1 Tax=Serratia TaxID=613 RepID=UPI00155E26D5|nr:hypothetical protein [Serratia ureilytica]
MSNSIELTRVIEWLKEHEERLTAHQYAIQSLLALLPQSKLDEAKVILRNTIKFNEFDRQKINDEAWLERNKGVRRELPHIIPGLFDEDE